MTEVVLTVLVSVVAGAVWVHYRLRRSTPVAEGAAALTVREDRPAGRSHEFVPRTDPGTWRSVVVTSLSAAEEVLDRAESDGFEEREVHVLDNSTFLVRWRCPG